MNRLTQIRGLLTFSLALCASSLLAQGRRPQNMGEQTTVEFEVRRWRPDLVSELRLSGNGIGGTDVDPTTDLLFPDEDTWDYRGQVRLSRRLRVRGGWLKTRYESEAAPNAPLSIAGVVVAAGDSLSSRMEIEQIRTGAEFDLVRGEYAFLAVVGEWTRFRVTNSFESASSTSEPEPLQIQLPVFGIKGRTYLTPALAVTVEATGMKRESEGVITDLDAVATYNAMPNLAFSYGYRNAYYRVKSIEMVDDRAVFRIRGQYFGVTVRF